MSNHKQSSFLKEFFYFFIYLIVGLSSCALAFLFVIEFLNPSLSKAAEPETSVEQQAEKKPPEVTDSKKADSPKANPIAQTAPSNSPAVQAENPATAQTANPATAQTANPATAQTSNPKQNLPGPEPIPQEILDAASQAAGSNEPTPPKTDANSVVDISASQNTASTNEQNKNEAQGDNPESQDPANKEQIALDNQQKTQSAPEQANPETVQAKTSDQKDSSQQQKQAEQEKPKAEENPTEAGVNFDTASQDKTPYILEIESFMTPFIYDPELRRDPFKNPIRKKITQSAIIPRTPLERYDLSELQLKGIIWDIKSPKALFEIPGQGFYTLLRGDKIGKNGTIFEIREDEVVIVETVLKASGLTQFKETEVKIIKLNRLNL